ncbi:ROK family transcriptional regulator [Virgibacillus salexigens]|uniref:ROK family transcriptional regulator n=1 Tax=Virgibacillus TaxID=84406 RepID=UPI001369166E|nr:MULTISPECIES: ROK family transcriptional regulator [Virgibacillus]MYL40781.1 ROK family protein [Virgibacillus massiliensis]
MQRGTFQLMKSVNKSIILNKIRTSEPISRAQIAKDTTLTPPTVSSIVKELIDQGIVMESELGKSMGGRKPTMLHINSDAYYVVGVDAGPETVACMLTNLSGEVFERISSKVIKPTTNTKFLAVIKENIQKILHTSPIQSEKIIGIGVAMHGVVNVKDGVSQIAPNLGVSNIPIKQELEEAFGLTVRVENDARAMALGESWFGGHGGVHSMVAVNIGRGVGSGIIINKQLYHGAEDIAGEIGHMTIDINGPICDCGNPGCLQTFITGTAIADRAQSKLALENGSNLTGKKVFERAQHGERGYIELLQETGIIIGIGLINLIHLLNPEKIVLGGGVMKGEKFIFPHIKDTIKQRALTSKAKETEITITNLGDDATLLGAVALLLVELFNERQ